jgi:hypothetical protein
MSFFKRKEKKPNLKEKKPNPRRPEGFEIAFVNALCSECVFNHPMKWDCEKYPSKKKEAELNGIQCEGFSLADSTYLACLCGAASTDKKGTEQCTAFMLAVTAGFTARNEYIFESVAKEVSRWYNFGNYTMDRMAHESDRSVIEAVRRLNSGMDMMLSGKNGMNDDSGYVLPVAFPAAFLASGTAGELSRAAAEIFNASDDATNGAEILGNTIVDMLRGFSYRDAIERNAGAFKERILSHGRSENAFDVMGMLYDAMEGNSFEACMKYDMPLKQVLGAIAGLTFGIKGIPMDTLKSIDAMPIICTVCGDFERHLLNLRK